MTFWKRGLLPYSNFCIIEYYSCPYFFHNSFQLQFNCIIFFQTFPPYTWREGLVQYSHRYNIMCTTQGLTNIHYQYKCQCCTLFYLRIHSTHDKAKGIDIRMSLAKSGQRERCGCCPSTVWEVKTGYWKIRASGKEFYL